MSRNLFLLETAAVRLGDLLREVVFVGGATLDLMVSDEGAAPVRPTTDESRRGWLWYSAVGRFHHAR